MDRHDRRDFEAFRDWKGWASRKFGKLMRKLRGNSRKELGRVDSIASGCEGYCSGVRVTVRLPVGKRAGPGIWR